MDPSVGDLVYTVRVDSSIEAPTGGVKLVPAPYLLCVESLLRKCSNSFDHGPEVCTIVGDVILKEVMEFAYEKAASSAKWCYGSGVCSIWKIHGAMQNACS